MSNRKISVAIAHYNNSNFMKDTLSPFINDDRINQIVICDDNSNDKSNLINIVDSFKCNKIVLYFNDNNIGSYLNKINTLSKCSNDWAILFDSDNILETSYIDTLYKIDDWNLNTIYAPDTPISFPGKPSPNFDYTKYSNSFITKKIFLDDINVINFQCLLNTCNYFVPVKEYLNCMNPIKYSYDRSEMDSLDSAVLISDWFTSGNNIFIVKGLSYKHRLHNNSNYCKAGTQKYEANVRARIGQNVRKYNPPNK